MMVELVGKKVILRTLEREHCRQLWLDYQPAQPVATEPINPGQSIEQADKWFEAIQNAQGKEQVYLGIFLADGQLIGDIQLSNIDWRNRSASLGVGIARKEHRNCGYGTDAVITMVRYAFDNLDLVRLSARTLVHNTGARKILENAGFKYEGCERAAVFIEGQRWDRLCFGLLKTEPT
jgi:RimJ/RimL family protein N-acetyltransferase